MAKSIINIVNISKRFVHKVLLDNVNLLIEEKSKIGMIGRNGAGKTTLLKILMGLEEAKLYARQTAQKAQDKLSILSCDTTLLKAFAEFTVSRDH